MLTAIAWVGTACMAVAPFLIDTIIGKLLAISGLALLTVQAHDAKLYNLMIPVSYTHLTLPTNA